jgi:hypothetical protein
MTDPITLLALAERCEQAAGPDKELDQDITKLLVPNNARHIHRSRRGWSFFVSDSGKGIEWLENQPYTASLDAAIALVPEGWIYELGRGESETSRALCRMSDELGIWTGWAVAATAALALCAVALRARAAAHE